MNESEETKDYIEKGTTENAETEIPDFGIPENLPPHIKELFYKKERTSEEEKEVEEAIFGKPIFTYQDKFRWFYFVSLSKTLDLGDPFRGVGCKEWVGDTKTDEIVVIRYSSAEGLRIGIGYSELRARINLEPIAKTLTHDFSMNIERMNSGLKLEWRLPDTFIDE